MNKADLIEHIAQQADISKASAARALDAALEAIVSELKQGGAVSLVGFGSFAVTHRAARIGRNPKTGETVRIEAAKIPKFKPGKVLKDAII